MVASAEPAWPSPGPSRPPWPQAVLNAIVLRRRARDAAHTLACVEAAMTPIERAAYKAAVAEGM